MADHTSIYPDGLDGYTTLLDFVDTPVPDDWLSAYANAILSAIRALEKRVGENFGGWGPSILFAQQRATPDLNLTLSGHAGVYFGAIDPLARTTGPLTSPAFVPSTVANTSRIDVLTINSTGGLEVTQGTPTTGTPTVPSNPAGKMPLWLVYLRPNSTAIYDVDVAGQSYIYADVRPRVVLPTAGSSSITSAMILNGTIVNADVSTGAAIAYSKLNLTGGIVDADVSTGAAIAYSKLNLTGSIGTADIANGSIQNSDVSDFAAITAYKINFPFVEATGTSYALSSTDFAVRANPSSNQAITLPSTTGVVGGMFRIKRWSTDGTVTLHAASSSGPQLIDGSTSFALTAQYQAIDLLPSTGRGWGVF